MNKRVGLQVVRLSLWMLTAAWMCVIFLFSAQNGTQSSALSGRITTWVLSLLGYNALTADGEAALQVAEFVVRKLAHFSEYAVLGMLLAGLVSAYQKAKGWYVFAAAAALLYAALDEWHQGFTPGRMPAVRDVLIDFSGALTGILLIAACVYWYRKKK